MASKTPYQTPLPIDPPDDTPDAQASGTRFEIVEAAIESLTAHPLNADIYRDDADEELVASVRDHGVTTPIEVTADGVVISGHRRVSAARQAGLETVPAFVRNYPTDEAAVTAMLRANLYRTKTKGQKDREIQVLLKAGKTVRAIQATTGVSKSQVGRVRTSNLVPNGTSVRPARTPSRNGSDRPEAVAKPSRGALAGNPATHAPHAPPAGSKHNPHWDTSEAPDRPVMAPPVNRMQVRLALDTPVADTVTDGPVPWRIRIEGHGSRSPQSLIPNPYGRGKPLDRKLDLAKQALATIGWFQPVTVNQRTGHIIDGHARVTMAIERRETLVPVMYLDLSLEEERWMCDFLDGIENDVPNRRPVIGLDDPGATVDDDPGDDTGHGPTDVDDDGTPLGHLEPMEIDPID